MWEMRMSALRAVCAVIAILSAAAQAGEVVELVKPEPALWQGEGKPVKAEYTPLVGKARPALRFNGPADVRASLNMNLENCDRIVLRLVSDRAVKPAVVFRSGEGSYRCEIEVGRGEQVVLIPTGAFDADKNVTGWEKVDDVQLILGDDARGARVDLLSFEAWAPGQEMTGEDLFLVKPVSRLDHIGMAWPIYAILDEIQYPERAVQAGGQLQRMLAEVYGCRMPVNPNELKAEKGITNVVLLGKEAALRAGTVTGAELDKEGYLGFVVRADDGAVTVASQSRHGTMYGLRRLMEKQGCAIFYGSRFLVVPKKQTHELLACDMADKPFFKGTILGMPREANGYAARAENQGMFDVDWVWTEHTAGYLVPKKLYYDEHPEYFALRGDGSRMPKETGDFQIVICPTNPEVLKVSAERMLRWIELQPDRKFFSCTMGDNHEWCRCDRCKAMEYEPGNYSDMMLNWVNYVAREVAKKYPDKILITYAYGPTTSAPVKFRPEKNVEIMYAAWPNKGSCGCGTRDFDAPENIVARKQILDWVKVAPGQVGLYDYNSGGRYTLYGMAWKVKWCARNGLCGFHYCGGNQSFKPVFDYVHAELNWDPMLDVHTLKHRFIRAYYGKAAGVVEEVFDKIYDKVEYGDYDSRMGAGGFVPADFFEPPYVREMLALFDKALTMLPEDKYGPWSDIATTRELFVTNCLKVARPAGRDYTEQELESFGICLKLYLEKWLNDHEEAVAKAKAENKNAPGYGGLASTLWNWTRVKVETDIPEGKIPPMIEKLMADPTETIKKNMVTNFVERIQDGWRVPANAFSGGVGPAFYAWNCEGRVAVWVRGTMTEVSATRAKLVLEQDPPDRDGVLEMEGQDSDKYWCPPTPIQIFVNDKKIFQGENGFPKCGWSRRTFKLPKGTLKKGENTIDVRNLFNSDSLASHWFMLSEVLVKFPKE